MLTIVHGLFPTFWSSLWLFVMLIQHCIKDQGCFNWAWIVGKHALQNAIPCSLRAIWIEVMVLLVGIHPMCLLVTLTKCIIMCLLVTKVSLKKLTMCLLVTKSFTNERPLECLLTVPLFAIKHPHAYSVLSVMEWKRKTFATIEKSNKGPHCNTVKCVCTLWMIQNIMMRRGTPMAIRRLMGRTRE